VQTQTGERHELDLVASNADVFHTYDRLLRNEPKAGRMRRRLAGMSYSMSLFLIYFGTRRQYPNLKHHNIIFGPRYRELLKDIFGRGRLADDFSLYLHAPTRSDPSLAPPGCEAFYVLSPVPHLGKLSVDWSVEGPRYAERILEYLERHYIPNLRNEIVTQRIFTPQDFQSELNAHFGSAFSLEPRLMQSAYFRVQNRDANLIGLYLVGAGTHPGAGIPGVVNSAKATAGLILDDIRKAVVVRSSNQVQRLSYA
jgi:phytoene desaturase